MGRYQLPDAGWDRIIASRIQRPSGLGVRLASRRRCGEHPAERPMVLLAANHRRDPVTGRPVSRRELLARLVAALSVEELDGVVASADLLEELTLLNVLEGRLAWCSLRGDSAEPERDPVATSLPAAIAARDGWDGVQTTLRFTRRPGSGWEVRGDRGGFGHGPRSGSAELARLLQLVVDDGPGPPAVEQWSSALTSLAATSATGAGLMVSIPAAPVLDEVVGLTALPVLIRDEAVPVEPAVWAARFQERRGPLVRGLIAGVSALFPADDDVAGATAALVAGVGRV